VENFERKSHLEDLDVEEVIILPMIFRKLDERHELD